MKKIIFSLCLVGALLASTKEVNAEDQVCVTQYGGGVVCGAKTPEFHAPVKAGLADLNLPIIGFSFIIVSGVLYFKSRSFTN